MKLYGLFVVAILPLISNSVLAAENGVLLNCDRYDGEQEFQIYINEDEEYVIYNAQNHDSYERRREVPVTNSDETSVIDFGLDITANNSAFIMASDNSASLVFVKRDASFAYAWTNPIPIREGIFAAFGNSHEGSCSINPFNTD